MFNRGRMKALIGAFIAGFKPAQQIVPGELVPQSVQSSGKSNKQTRKASGAAVLKRAAKKRNNIRKHNK